MHQIRVSIGAVEAGMVKLLALDDMQMFEVPCKMLPPELLESPGQIACLSVRSDAHFEQQLNDEIELIQSRLFESIDDVAALKRHVESDDGVCTVANVYHDSIILHVNLFDPTEHMLTVYSKVVLMNGEEVPVDGPIVRLDKLSPDTDYHIKLLIKTSDGYWESKEMVVRTREASDLSFIVYIADDCKAIEVPSPFSQTTDLSSADYYVSSNVNDSAAKEVREKYKIKIVTPEWISSCPSEGH